ncbi:MAG: hypothetical protein AB7H85_16495 [Dehalococcoidia bacterium]
MSHSHPISHLDLTIRLRSWNELYGLADKRYYHALDGDGKTYRTVEITRDRRVACRCGSFQTNLRLGLGPCVHIDEALDFLDAVGWQRMPTWTLRKSRKAVAA